MMHYNCRKVLVNGSNVSKLFLFLFGKAALFFNKIKLLNKKISKFSALLKSCFISIKEIEKAD